MSVSRNTNEEFFLRIMEQSSIGILISSQTHIVYSNLAFQSMFNIQKEINDDFSINELINVIVDEDKPLFYSFLNPVLLHDLVYRVQSSNNNEIWVLHLPKYIKYDQKSVIFSQFIDISSFKERETALIENFANLNAILEASSDLLWVLDKNLHVTFMNINTAAVLYKIFKQDFKLGSSFIDKIPIEIQGIWRSRFEQTLNGDSLLITEEYGKLDQKVFYEFCFNPVINSNKEIIGATVLGRDITEFKNFILKLKDSNVERSIQLTNTIEHLQKEIKERRKIEETLIEAKDLAEAANRAKTEFLANMSHELRTPLNAILGFSQLLIDQNSSQNPDEKEFLTNINESGKHLLTLINDILDLSKIESGKNEIVRVDFDLFGLFESVISLFYEKSKTKNIRIELDIRSKDTSFYGDQTRIKQVLYNLVSNAMKFTDKNGRIGIICQDAENGIEICVWDTGIGISEENQKLLFRPFRQVENTYTKRFEGSGLGLYLSKKLISLHGGSIRVESKENEGSKFFIFLPYVKNTINQIHRIMTFGLEKSGKTSFNLILSKGKIDTNETPIYHESFEVEFEQKKFSVFDIPFNTNINENWGNHINNTNIVIFVIDLTNMSQIVEAREYFDKIYSIIGKTPKIIILFHKIDLIRANINLKAVREIFTNNLDQERIIYLNTSILIPETIDKVRRTILSLVE